MRNKIKYLILFIGLIGFAQSNQPTNKDDYSPPTPTASNLGNYGKEGVGLFTGKPNVNIPLYNYKIKNFEVPISLGYSSNGIKVDQPDSNVGLGWVLNVGGVITRQINDLDDLITNHDFDINDINNIDKIVANSEPSKDTEPDEYTYNLLGKSGRFFINQDSQVVQINHDKLIIIFDFIKKEFQITDVDGIKYFFKEKEISRVIKSGSNPGATPSSITAWYLNEIQLTTGQKIYFEYKKSVNFYTLGNEESYKKPVNWYEYGDNLIFNVLAKSRLGEKVWTSNIYDCSDYLLIQKIYSDKLDWGQVVFEYDGNFISKIKAIDSNLKIIQKIDFENFTTSNYRVFLNKLVFNDTEKSYLFEYEQPEELCLRLSFSKDKFGYYNGAPNTELLPMIYCNEELREFQNIGTADRNINPDFTGMGMLKKVTYPTGGSTIFEYEANEYFRENDPGRYTTRNVNKIDKYIDSETATHFTSISSRWVIMDTLYFTTGDIVPCHGAIISMQTDIANDAYLPQNYPHFPLASTGLTLYDDQTNEIINIENNSITQTSLIADPNPDGINQRTGYVNDLLPYHTYRVEISSDGSVGTNLQIDNLERNSLINPYNSIGPGMRVKNKIERDGISQKITRYYYTIPETIKPNIFSKSSGVLYVNPYNLTKSQTRYHGCTDHSVNFGSSIYSCEHTAPTNNVYIDDVQFIDYKVLNANSIRPLTDSSGNIISYSNVYESFGGDNFENGGIAHEFNVTPDQYSTVINGLLDAQNKLDNYGEWNNGKEKQTIFYNSNFKNVKKIEYVYEFDPNNEIEYDFYTIRNTITEGETWMFLPPQVNMQKYDLLHFENYKIYCKKTLLTEKKETVFDDNGLNPIEIKTNYFYDNLNHYQLTNETFNNSKGENLETKYFYADELNNTLLKNENMISLPLKVQTFKNSVKLSEYETIYIKDDSTSNLILPKFIKTAKESLITQMQVTYDLYDNNGNVLQYTKEGGIPVTVIWDYNNTLPVAIIQNATFQQVDAIVNPVFTITAENQSVSLMDLNNLRTSLPNAMVTTYTYIPLVGVSTITDPKGNKTTYEYDDFNRLKQVKDHQGNVLSENQYHYKN